MATVITEKLTINGEGKNIVLDGLDFTANGYVEVYQAASVTIQNCRVYNMTTPSTKNYWLHIYNDIPIKLTVSHCFFGSNPSQMYNLLELTAELLNGSSISNNYFAESCCSHNVINVYGAADNAVLDISGNVIAVTAGGIRIGVKKSPGCRIAMRNNTVLANDPRYTEADYGLCTIQPYGKQTTTFANMTVVFDGNQLPCEQTAYGYSGSADTELTEDTMPKIIVNGAIATIPIYH